MKYYSESLINSLIYLKGFSLYYNINRAYNIGILNIMLIQIIYHVKLQDIILNQQYILHDTSVHGNTG